MKFNYLNVFKPNDVSFLFEIEAKKNFYVVEKIFTFETKDTIVKYSSELGFNDVIYPYVYSEENIYSMFH